MNVGLGKFLINFEQSYLNKNLIYQIQPKTSHKRKAFHDAFFTWCLKRFYGGPGELNKVSLGATKTGKSVFGVAILASDSGRN